MKLIIDIPNYVYNGIKTDYVMSEIVHNDCYPYIANGIPLPKGHGDLIDRKELLKQPMDTANYPSNYVRSAKTVIEADKESEET